MKKIILMLCLVTAVPACSNKTEDLKSPCVGGDNSPCDRRPVNGNDWPMQG